MQRYFVKETYEPKEYYTLTGEPYHHIVHVMRMTVGQQVHLVFDQQLTILAEIYQINSSEVLFVERGKEQVDNELPIHVTIASGFPKGDKLEWIVQKGTELGAQAFIGFPAKTSVVKWDHKKQVKKAQRLEKIALEAAEQSHRQIIPTVQLLGNKPELINSFAKYDHVLVAYEESAKLGEKSHFASILTEMSAGQTLLLLFGPEGGFSPDEILLFQENQAVLCGLGPRILRTETAPLYALSAVSYHFELM